MPATHSIRRLDPAGIAAHASALGALFVDAVEDGASIGYVRGLTVARAADYWQGVAAAPNGRAVLASEDDAGIAGVVIVAPIVNDFQPHRVEISKMVVHRRARGRGLGAALMNAAEAEVRAMGRNVATLMTRDGCEAERLYRKLGWTKIGIIPDDSIRPDGVLCDAAIFFKRIAS
jgi:GNAT superfamily N-acetyltransferase